MPGLVFRWFPLCECSLFDTPEGQFSDNLQSWNQCSHSKAQGLISPTCLQRLFGGLQAMQAKCLELQKIFTQCIISRSSIHLCNTTLRSGQEVHLLWASCFSLAVHTTNPSLLKTKDSCVKMPQGCVDCLAADTKGPACLLMLRVVFLLCENQHGVSCTRTCGSWVEHGSVRVWRLWGQLLSINVPWNQELSDVLKF